VTIGLLRFKSEEDGEELAETIPQYGEMEPVLRMLRTERAALELLGGMLASLPFAVAIYDASDDDLRAVYLNPLARELTGVTGDVAGRPFAELHPDSTQSEVAAAFRLVRATGATQSRRRYRGASNRVWNFDIFRVGGQDQAAFLLAIGNEEARPETGVDLEALIEGTEATWRRLSPRDLAERATMQGSRIVEGVECMITLISAETPDVLEIVAGTGPWAESLVGRRMPAAGTFSGQAIALRSSVETTDALANSTARVHLIEGAMNTLRVVPLSTGDAVPDGRSALGVIGFYRAGRTPFRPSERQLMDQFGRWITLGLHRAELLEEAEAAARRLQTGVDIAIDLGASLDSRTVIERLLERALEAVEADRVGLVRVEGDSTVIEGSLDRDPNVPVYTVGTRHRIFSSTFRRMLAEKRAIAEPYDPAEFPPGARSEAESLRGSITVPLVHGGEVFAALSASRRGEKPFGADDLAMLQQVGTVAGLALRNAGLFTEVEASRDRARGIARSLRLGVEVAVDLSSQLDPDEVVRRLLRRVVAATGADRGSLSYVDGDSIVIMDASATVGEPPVPGTRWPAPPGSLIGEAISTQQPVQLTGADPALEASRSLGESGHGLAVPLSAQGQVLYMLGLVRATGSPFSDEEIATLQQVGSVAVLSLRNAQLFRAKTDFMNLAAHELRTPLAVLNGYLSMLQDGTFGVPSDAWQRPVGVLVGKTRELGQLVENLLVGARLDSGHLIGSPVRLDLVTLAGEAVARAEARLALVGGELRLEASAEPVWIHGDADQLARIVDNLINNALTYSDGPPSVVVAVNADDQAALRVSDRGRGIPADLHERVFEQFYRIEDRNAGNPSGTGLGLYISRQLAVRHGGTLAIATSTLDEGSVFELRLPLAR